MSVDKRFLPPEWYSQSGVQIAWPHAATDWAGILEETHKCYLEIAAQISAREKLVIVTPYPDDVKKQIAAASDLKNVVFCKCDINDTWARDHGAITVLEKDAPVLLDFMFNGWGLKFASNHDNLITRAMLDSGLYSDRCMYENRLGFVLEGGSIESDGKGTILTTSECLLSPNRNGGLSRGQIESYLKEAFNAEKILFLDHGYLAGDDTDSHIDTLARLCPDDVILYVKCENSADEHFEALRRMEDQLKTFTTPGGAPFSLVPLPMADPVFCGAERLPATYANFLVINGAVLVPSYNQPLNDEKAREAVAGAFPGREIILIDCSVLIKQHGSLHCVTMQYPEGVFCESSKK